MDHVSAVAVWSRRILSGWARESAGAALAGTVEQVEAVVDGLGGRHVSAGESGIGDLDLDATAARLARPTARLGRRGLLLAVEACPWFLGHPRRSPRRRAGTEVRSLLEPA